VTPPTAYVTLTVLVIEVPEVVPTAYAGVAIPVATANKEAATLKRVVVFMMIFLVRCGAPSTRCAEKRD